MKVRQFVRDCNCNDAQIVRFCQKIGLKGFQELKSSIADDFIPVKLTVPHSEAKSEFEQVRQDFQQNYLQVLKDTTVQFDEQSVTSAVDAVFKAKRIYLCGMGASGIVAQDFQIKLSRMGFNAFYTADTELSKTYCALLETNDVLIAVSFSGENLAVIDVAKIARKHGATVIGISNYPKSPLSESSDLLLLTASEESAFRLGAMGSRIAQFWWWTFYRFISRYAMWNGRKKPIIQTHKHCDILLWDNSSLNVTPTRSDQDSY